MSAQRDLDGPKAHHRRVVVGVDGSAGADRALAAAVRQAALLDARLEIYACWHMPGYSGYPSAYNFGELADVAKEFLEAAEAKARAIDPDVALRGRVEEGVAAHRLVQASRGADLLVVGSRGLGGFTGALLGSVSRYCIEHAHCPVLVERPPARHDTAADTPEAEVAGHEELHA